MQGNDSFRLVVRRGPQPNQIYELNKDILTVGRDITNDIVINDPEVSRHHLRFSRSAGSFTIEDLGSTNGTFINGQRLAGAKLLSAGDMIGLGETVTLAYESGGGRGGAGSDFGPDAPARMQQKPRPSVAPDAPHRPPQSPYQQPAVSPYEQPEAGGYQVAPQPPPGADFDYDPYAIREDEPRSTVRWIIFGCLGIGLFCCCITLASIVVIDQLCLWNDIPVISDVLEAVGFYAECV